MTTPSELPTAPEPRKGNSIAAAGGIMMGSLLLSRILGLLRETVLAAKFGVGLDADSWRLASTIPDMLFMLIAGGGLSSAFIPVFSEFIYTHREKDAWKVFSVVMTLCSIVVTVLIGIAWVFSPQIAAYFCAAKTQTLANGTVVSVAHLMSPKVAVMGQIMLPAQFAFLVGSILLGTLYARKYFWAPGLAPNVYNVGIIGGALAGAGSGLGIAGMAWGALIGAILGNLVLPSMFMIGKGGWLKPSLDFRAPGVGKFFKLLLPVILGFSLPSVCGLIMQKYAGYYSEGINTIIQSSYILMMAPLGVFGHSLALAAFPALSQFFAQDRMDMYRDQVSKTVRTTIYLGMPASAIMLALAPQIVNLAFGYGKAANHPEKLAAIAASLQVFALAIWAWCVQPVLMRGFFSIHQTARPVIIGTVMTVLFIGLCWLNLGSRFGFLGLPICTDIAATLLVIALYFGLEAQVGKLDRSGIAKTLAKSLLASAVMSGMAFGAFRLVPDHLRKVPLFLVFMLVLCAVGWVYFYSTVVLKMPETEYLTRAFARLNRKGIRR